MSRMYFIFTAAVVVSCGGSKKFTLLHHNAKYNKTSMARTPWNHKNMFEAGVVRASMC